MLVPISVFSKSTISSVGIFSVGHFNSTFLLTIFNTPPFFNPGDLSLLINLTGISKIILIPLTILKKSICKGSSVTGSKLISLGKTFSSFPLISKLILFDKKFSELIRFFIVFLLI